MHTTQIAAQLTMNCESLVRCSMLRICHTMVLFVATQYPMHKFLRIRCRRLFWGPRAGSKSWKFGSGLIWGLRGSVGRGGSAQPCASTAPVEVPSCISVRRSERRQQTNGRPVCGPGCRITEWPPRVTRACQCAGPRTYTASESTGKGETTRPSN